MWGEKRPGRRRAGGDNKRECPFPKEFGSFAELKTPPSLGKEGGGETAGPASQEPEEHSFPDHLDLVPIFWTLSSGNPRMAAIRREVRPRFPPGLLLDLFSSFLKNRFHVRIDKRGQSAKFWLRPVGIARNTGFGPKELREIRGTGRTQSTILSGGMAWVFWHRKRMNASKTSEQTRIR